MAPHQLAGAYGSGRGEFGRHPFAEASRGFAEQFQRLRSAAVVDVIKIGRFQENVGGLRSDLALQPAHHTGDGHRAAAIGDQQYVRRQAAQLAVESGDRLTGPGPADDDRRWAGAARPRPQAVVVESVQRLPPLQHHVVGDVHNIGDGTHAGQGQAALQPIGRGADLHVPDQRSSVPPAQVGVGDLQLDLADDRWP